MDKKKKVIKVGLAGNPNCGKTTIFNNITGSKQKVANYAGVTVDKKEGNRHYKGYDFIVYDLPGVYSLSAYSIDEMVARDFIIDEKPDIIVNVLDATNLERNLYLLLQFQELGIPVVSALNIVDQAEARGIRIDDKTLSKILGVSIVKTVGTKGIGIEEILDKVIEIFENKKLTVNKISYGNELETEVDILEKFIADDDSFSKIYSPRWFSIKLLEKDKNAFEILKEHKNYNTVNEKLEHSIKRIEDHFGNDSEIVVSEQRYAYVHGAVSETVKKIYTNKTHMTDIIDRVLINRYLGLPIFLFILWGIFQITFKIGEYPMGWLELFFGFLSDKINGVMPDGILKSLIVDGIIGGVGGVLSFVPLIIILFFCISLLEDLGYMARASFIMDKFLHMFGLHGQSFLPMMIGFGCSVPAIMASRSLKSQRDRITTILITPFMSCGAKLPVYVLLAGAFFKKNASTMVLLIYIIGVVIALISSKILKLTVLKGEPTPFVMELPPYRVPTFKGILFHVTDKSLGYIKRAGTVLLAASIVIWAMVTFPKMPDNLKNKILVESSQTQKIESIKSNSSNSLNEINESDVKESSNDETGNLIKEEELSYSFAGRLGKFIEPAIRPIGFDWKIGMSAITGFAAKEIVVSTLGILYKVETEDDGENIGLKEAIQNDKTFSPLVAFVLMLFMLIVAPCIAAQSTIKAELGWKWLGFFYLFTTFLAWGLCFGVYQIGKLFGLGI